MKRSRFVEMKYAFIISVVFMVGFKLFYAADMSEIKKIHSSGDNFLPVTANIYKYYSDRKRDSDGGYEQVYDCKYVYVVNDKAYYFVLDDCFDIIENKKIYYNPSNPEIYSFYASYEQAVEEFNVCKFIGDIFFIISSILLLIIIYFSIFGKQYIVNDSKKINLDDIPLDKPYILDEYGIWSSEDIDNFNKDEHSKFKVSQVGDKEVVDEIETIPFNTKNSIINNDEDNKV